MVFDKENKTVTLNEEEIVALTNCLSKFANVLYQPKKHIRDLLKWRDFEDIKWWLDRFLYG